MSRQADGSASTASGCVPLHGVTHRSEECGRTLRGRPKRVKEQSPVRACMTCWGKRMSCYLVPSLAAGILESKLHILESLVDLSIDFSIDLAVVGIPATYIRIPFNP